MVCARVYIYGSPKLPRQVFLGLNSGRFRPRCRSSRSALSRKPPYFHDFSRPQIRSRRRGVGRKTHTTRRRAKSRSIMEGTMTRQGAASSCSGPFPVSRVHGVVCACAEALCRALTSCPEMTSVHVVLAYGTLHSSIQLLGKPMPPFFCRGTARGRASEPGRP
ncbi:hypothetical protein DENSPDRAFT_175439 [Dentipellis sp. KUC8613]|nr:hypothetical protein DENSPDRAFT_175439 [Dentipellis sp. KUC8613]